MSFWSWLWPYSRGIVLPDPGAEPGDIVEIAIQDIFGELHPSIVTADSAMRIPGVKRGLAAHLALLGKIQFRQYADAIAVEPQPAWLTTSASGLSPAMTRKGVFKDMFFYGWAALGFELGPDGYPIDALHIPYGMWGFDSTGKLEVTDQRVDARYQDRVIAIPLGLNGFLVDAVDAIHASQKIEQAYQHRLDSPVAQTELHHIRDVDLSLKEKRKIITDYEASRSAGATSFTPFDIEVKEHGQVESTFFETGRNAARLDIANHALVPASVIEGAKNGSAGEMNYSNSQTARNELYDYGTVLFVEALESRLSLDDVCPPGLSIRADLTGIVQTPEPTLIPVED